MPYPKYDYVDEDPEEVAEREFEKNLADLGLPSSRGPTAAVKKALPSAPQPSRKLRLSRRLSKFFGQ